MEASPRPRVISSAPANPVSGNAVDLIECILVVAALFSFTGAVFPLLERPDRQGVTNFAVDHTSPILHAIAYALTPILFWRAGLLRWRYIKPPISLSVLVGVGWVSILWSWDSNRSLRSAILVTATAAFGVYFAKRFTPRQQLVLLAWTLGITTIISIGFVVLAPEYGISTGVHSGNWRGAFSRKTAFGQFMALTAGVYALLALTTPKWAIFHWFVVLISLVLVALSSSGGGIVLCASLVLLFPLFAIARSRRLNLPVVIALTLAVIVLVGWVLYNYWVEILGLLGKDTTLTGRQPLWTMVAFRIAQEPVLGYGLTAFWEGNDKLYVDIWKALGWQPPHSHNGFLDLALDAGVVGVVLFMVGFIFEYIRSLYNVRRSQVGIETAWPVVMLTFFFVSNLTEVSILRHTAFLWLLYVAAVSAVSTTSRQLRGVRGSARRVRRVPRAAPRRGARHAALQP